MTIKTLLEETDEGRIINALDFFYNQGLNIRHKYESRWAMCERFYKGSNIDTNYIGEIAEHILPDLKKNGYVHIENAIKPLVKQAMAIICDRMSSVTVIPATTEVEDIIASIIAADFLKSREEVDDEMSIRRDELTNLLVYGECARFTRYNPNIITQDGIVGDIETITLDTSQYLRSITDKRQSKPEWVITSEVYDLDILQSMFPNKNIKADNVYITKYGKNRLQEYESTKDKCLVKRIYIRENNKYKNGSYYAWTGDTVLQGRQDLPDGIFPFVIMQWLYVPGNAYPEGFVEPLIKPQITINDNLLKIKKLSDKKANPPVWIAGKQSVWQETLESGVDLYHYQMGMDRPEFVQFTHDLNDARLLIDYAREEMMANAGIRETSLGRQPREATATQVAALKESDNLGIGYFKYAFERSYAQICYIKLRLAQKHFKQKRLIRTVGINHEPNISEFYGADIKSVLDVIVKPTPYMTEAMRQQIVMQLTTAGAFSQWQGLEDGLSKMIMIMNSGLNNARDIVNSILGTSITFEQLAHEVSAFRSGKTTLEIMQLEVAKINTQLQGEQMKMQLNQMLYQNIAQQMQGNDIQNNGTSQGNNQMQQLPEENIENNDIQNI